MLKMLKSPCICTTFSRFNIFDEKMLKMLKMLKFSIFWYKKLSPAAPVTPPYSMYYIFRFWGKLKSLTKWMHFNFFFVQNVLTFFLTFPLQFLTFRLTFWKFGKKNQGFPKIHFHRMLYMRSRADHGEHPQIMRHEKSSFRRYVRESSNLLRFFSPNWRFVANDRISQRIRRKCKVFFT